MGGGGVQASSGTAEVEPDQGGQRRAGQQGQHADQGPGRDRGGAGAHQQEQQPEQGQAQPVMPGVESDAGSPVAPSSPPAYGKANDIGRRCRRRCGPGGTGTPVAVEPLPEVRAAADRLGAITGMDVLDNLDALAELAVAVVPSCVGVSLTVVIDGDPFTLTCTPAAWASLDAIQYLEGGPCVSSSSTREPTSVPDVLDERRWQVYGRAAGGLGIRSSLSLPIGREDGGQTPGAINLYATDPNAFAGTSALLAAALQVPADHLVTNADLSFATRDRARDLPELLDAKEALDDAVEVLTLLHGWDAGDARRRLRAAAARAGAPIGTVADLVLALYIN